MINLFLEVVLVAMGVVMFENRSVRRSATALVRHVLPIVLLVNGSAVFAQVIHAPRLIEGDALLLGERVAEFSYGNLQSRKSGLEFIFYPTAIIRPVTRYGVQAGEHFKEGSSELGISRTPGEEALNSKCPKHTGQGANHCERPDRKIAEKLADIAHAFLYGVILAAIALVPVFLAENKRRRGGDA